MFVDSFSLCAPFLATQVGIMCAVVVSAFVVLSGS